MRREKLERQWERMSDVALPEERALIARLLKARPDMAPVKMTSRDGPGYGQFSSLTKKRRYSFGSFIIDVAWIEEEIARCRKQAAAERRAARKAGRQEALTNIGAGI